MFFASFLVIFSLISLTAFYFADVYVLSRQLLALKRVYVSAAIQLAELVVVLASRELSGLTPRRLLAD